MKQKLLNSLRLQLCTLVACLLCAFNGQAWGQTYKLVKSADGLETGAEYLLVNFVTTSQQKALGAVSSNVGQPVTVNIANETINISSEQVAVLTLSGTSGAWSLKSSLANKYLAYTKAKGTTKNNNLFLVDNTSTNGATWSITIQETGQATITNVYNNDRSLQFNSDRFCCYTSTQSPVALYKKEVSSSATATTISIDATGITNTDVYSSTTAGSLSASVTADGTAVEGATVTWSSSDTNVATIDANGAVTLVAAGTTTITASYAGVTDQYQASSTTYELTVTDSSPSAHTTTIEITPNYTFWGKEAQFSGSTYDQLSGSKDEITLSWNRGSGSTYANQNAMRFYKDNTLTFTAPDGYEIKSIVLDISGTFNDLSFSPDEFNSTTKTWTGSAHTVTMSRPSNASSYATINKYTITIGLASSEPSISAPGVTLTYDATSGSIEYTLTNPVEGITLAAEVTEGDWLTLGTVGETSIPFTCEANNGEARTATVTLTYGTITKTVTVTQAAAPVVYSTIPALFEAATSTETDVTINFGGWVISAVKNSNAYLTDNQGHGLIIHANEHGFQVNDVLTGTVSCKLQLYRGSAELTELTSTTEGLSITHDGAVSAQTIAISELSGVNTGALFSYERLTYTGSELKDVNGNTITPYTTLFNGAFENGKIYNVTGIYLQYNSTKELLPRSADDIVEVLAPSIVADNVHIACDATSGEISYTINNPVEGTNLSASEDVEWISDVTVDATNHKVTFTTTANTGAERSGVITLTYGSVTKEVTVSQAVYTITSTYTLATSIVSGKHYVIASGEEDKSPGVVNVMATQKDNNRGATYGTLNGNDLSVSGHAELVIYGPDANGFYSIYDAVEGGYLYAASSSSNYLRTQVNNNDNGLWSISIDETGIATITAQGDKTRNKMRYNSQNSVFSCYGSGQDDIYLYVKDGEETPNESVTVSNAGYATYCSENALDFTNSDIKAFIGTKNGTSLVFNKINKVPANTGVLLYMPGGKTEDIPVATAADNATVNCLVGVTAQTTITADDYILSRSSDGVGFYKAGTHTTLAANRAYIPASTATGIKSFAINFGDADGVEEIGNGQLTMDNAVIYNLAGQRLQKLQKGVNIIGGKKVVVK